MNENPHEEFLSLYKPIHEPFTRFCGSHAYGIMETQDLVQGTVLQTMQNFSKIKDKSKLLYFMIGVAGNIVKNALRRKKFNADIDEKRLLSIQSIADPEMAMDIHYLYRALNKLPVKMKEAIILFEINGMSMREIAEIQNASEGAVKTMISRGRNKLKDLLSENEVNYVVQGGKTLFSLIL